MGLTLRPYQQECLDRLIWDLDNESNSLVVVPQGGGKSHILASYIQYLNKPVVVLQPTREILNQNYSKLHYTDPKADLGVFSASLDRKEEGKMVTFATIGSVYKKPELFCGTEYLIIDEADLVGVRKTNMYQDFIKAVGFKRVIGFTGTPYRMATRTRSWGNNFWQKEVYSVTELINRVWPPFWKRIIYNISTQELIDQGYLSPLVYVDETVVEQEKIPINKTRSDFDIEKYWTIVKEVPVEKKIAELNGKFNSILCFCVNIEQAECFNQVCFPDKKTAVVTHKTKKKDRTRIVEEFKRGDVYAVFNVQTLTVGFDHPALDCIVLTRPTRSIRLYNQMIGRGTRISDDKKHCTVIDFSGTVSQLGKVETFRIEKVDDKWEIVSEKGTWHNKELYSFKIKNNKQDV